MKALFNLTEAIKAELEANALINSVTFGDLLEVDLNKQDIFPMAHVGLTSATIGSSTSTVQVSILFLDVVDISKDENTDKFFGNDNEHWVLNSMMAAATKTIQSLLRGDLYSQLFQVEDDANVEFFSERFEDKLAGCGVDFTVTISNNIDQC